MPFLVSRLVNRASANRRTKQRKQHLPNAVDMQRRPSLLNGLRARLRWPRKSSAKYLPPNGQTDAHVNSEGAVIGHTEVVLQELPENEVYNRTNNNINKTAGGITPCKIGRSCTPEKSPSGYDSCSDDSCSDDSSSSDGSEDWDSEEEEQEWPLDEVLRTLSEMGFTDEEMITKLYEQHGGFVDVIVDVIFDPESDDDGSDGDSGADSDEFVPQEEAIMFTEGAPEDQAQGGLCLDEPQMV